MSGFWKLYAIAVRPISCIWHSGHCAQRCQTPMPRWLDESVDVPSANEVPLGHKIALKDLKVGDTIFKYGHDIGKVVKEIKKGEHVHVHNVKTKKW